LQKIDFFIFIPFEIHNAGCQVTYGAGAVVLTGACQDFSC
jgi:hypothetical protein